METTALSSPQIITHKTFSWRRITAIAHNTLTELIRLKVFYFLLIFALIMIGNSAFMLKFTFQEEFQVLKDVSLGAMSIFTSLIAIAATAMLLPKDVEDRTLYTILAKPVPRFDYLAGKLLGVLLLLFIATVLMSTLFGIVLFVREKIVLGQILAEAGGKITPEADEMIRNLKAASFSWGLAAGIAIIYLKACLLASLTLLVSTFATTAIFTIIVSFAVYFIGHLQATAREYWMVSEEHISWLSKGFLAIISLIFPDLQMFNLVDDIAAGNAIAMDLFLKTAGLGVLYVGVYLLVAHFIFSAKEL